MSPNRRIPSWVTLFAVVPLFMFLFIDVLLILFVFGVDFTTAISFSLLYSSLSAATVLVYTLIRSWILGWELFVKFSSTGLLFLFFLTVPFVILSVVVRFELSSLFWILAAFAVPFYVHRFVWVNLNEARKYLWLFLLHSNRKFRHDWHLLQLSPAHRPTTSLLRFWQSAKQIYSRIPLYGFITILLLGSVVIPVLQVLNVQRVAQNSQNLENSTIEVASAPLTTTPVVTLVPTDLPTGTPTVSTTTTAVATSAPTSGSGGGSGATSTPSMTPTDTPTATFTPTATYTLTQIGIGIAPSSSESDPTPPPQANGGIVEVPINFLELATLGFVSTVLGSLFWGVLLVLQNQPRHLVTRFAHDEKQPDLRIMAEILTQSLASNLQNIGHILSSQRSDNIQALLENPLTFLVAGGQQSELITQLSSWEDIQAASVKVPLGRLLSLIVYNFALTRVSGSVHRSEDGGIEIWVDVFQNGKRGTFEVGRVVLPSHRSGFINEIDLRKAAEELAIRLTFALGNVQHLASTWENLRVYIDGQRASEKRQWWHAYALYRRWTQSELPIRGHFALGLFHLGTTLLSQGEPVRAQDMLMRARETSETPHPGINYTLALVLLALNSDDLNDDEGKEFSFIKRLLEDAIKSNPDFSEAYHLLGIAYYQRGKNFERSEDKPTRQVDATEAYEDAKRYLTQTVQSFRKRIVQYGMTPFQNSPATPDIKRLMLDYLTAIHHLADVLRSLGEYDKAILHFEDVIEANPQSMRSFIDLLMTYCLKRDWQEVIDRVEIERIGRGYSLWHADASLYLGWAYAGLAKAKNKPKDFRKALMYLDFALTLRPRFAKPRRQTAWIQQFSPQKAYTGQDDIRTLEETDKERQITQTWLAYRMQILSPVFPYLVEAGSEIDEIMSRVRERLVTNLPESEITSLQKQRYLLAERLFAQDKAFVIVTLPDDVKNKPDAGDMRTEWCTFHAAILQKLDGNNVKCLAGRQQMTDFLEYSLLLCRVCAEAKQWGDVFAVAGFTRNVIAKWHKQWYQVIPSNNNDGLFSPYVSRYQILSIGAWEVLARIEMNYQAVASRQSNAKILLSPIEIVQSILEKGSLTFNDLETAADAHRQLRHPLFLYVRARFFESKKLYRDANTAYNLLLEVIEQFDTKVFRQTRLSSVSRTDNASVNVNFRRKGLGDPRTLLYYLERVSGQQSFDFLISKPLLHSALARNYALIGDFESCVEQLLHALEASPYNDLDLVNFAALAHALLKLNRFDEGVSVVEEAIARRAQLEGTGIQFDDRVPQDFEFRVLECILLTRQGKFSESLERGLILLKEQEGKLDKLVDWNSRKTRCLKLIVQAEMIRGEPPYDAVTNATSLKDSPNESLLRAHIKGSGANYRTVFYLAELLNNIAYNQVKLESDLNTAWISVLIAIEMMRICGEDSPVSLPWYFVTNERLALFYDTLAWLYYRRRQRSIQTVSGAENTGEQMDHLKPELNIDLHKAVRIILDKANVDKPGVAVVHYHLSYIFISCFEDLWQHSGKDENHLVVIAGQLQDFLRKSLFHWNLAGKYDINNRLEAELRSLRNRIRVYTEAWEQVQGLRKSDAEK